ncbi:OPT oligopeptide transporter [Mycena belliarum]|uniref:OPT oligopeptide transporter n=1 Tax=Mycena belliarum TaxID=1033014 RepID=A0AAD6XW45_9AGAR|nr:OPT oligopeptide transporter [Mycena belliae]
MASIAEALPVVTVRPAPSEYLDEKASDTKEHVFSDKDSDIGEVCASLLQPDFIAFISDIEVCEEIRAIDMDEDGKEKPIVTASDWSTRLISLQDDPTLPVWTFRLWFLALGLSAFGAVLAEIFAILYTQTFRPQTVYVSQLFLQVASFALGKVLEELIPGPGHKRFKMTDNAFWRFMNPGPKENVGILIMAAAATHGALAINIFAADDLYYGFTPNPAIAIFCLLGSQLLGYGIAGMMRSFLVYPTYCVFPNLIPTIQMFDVLFRNQDNILQRKRIKFFWVLFVGIFIWEWFPEYFAPTLTGISVFCLARRDSPWVTRLFGGAAGNEGLGLFSICLDWNYVGSGGSAYALFQPLSTQLSLFAGVLICILSFTGAYATNVWNARNFPFLSQVLFYEDGRRYNQTLILNPDFTLNEEKLAIQGLPWFSASYTIAKIGSSLSFGATITHMIIWNGKQVWEALRSGQRGECQDAHYLKMKVYDEVPFWWYTLMFVASLAMGMATNYTAKSQLPWWGFFIAVGFAVIFLPIISTLYAILCYVPGTQDIARMLGAGLIPGKPQANMYFTLYAYNSTEQGRSMTRDLKMGQYTKLPPRVTFTMIPHPSTDRAITALINYVIMKSIIAAHRDILTSSFNSDAIAWGALAKHLYSPSSIYGIVPLSILIGLFVPIPFYLLHRYYPKAHFDGVITPMICSEIGYLSGTMSAALDGGTEVMTFVYSFAVGGAGGKTTAFPTWALNPTGNPDHCMRLT